jgi:ubiquinone/menaquinone biosynthesis C-methylase UbiE
MGVGHSTTVVDLAAGTGKLTRALLTTGARVVAVEPVPAMRTMLSKVVPGVEVLDGTAEAIPLPDSSADAVTVAQAFHWFQGADALPEIHRVLRARGSLGLIWNVRDLEQPLQADLQAIVARYGAGVPTQADTRWLDSFLTTSLFTQPEKREFQWDNQRDAEGFVAFAASLSQLAAAPDEIREAALDEVRKLTARLPDRFSVRFRTEAYVCSRS